MIQILLATYNSSGFLAEQLDSIFAQTYNQFELLIRDGGSKDNTLSIIEDYQTRFSGKIRLIGSQAASACENFAALLAAADAELLMFCDHDDVWKKEKIELSLQAYKEMEAKYTSAHPILVFTDSEVVDSNLVTQFPSMMRSQNLNRNRFSPGRTLIQNYASGNTMLFNRALQKLTLPIGKSAIMHDHWVALTAAFFGKICYVDKPLIRYRQHGGNVVGSFSYNFNSCVKRFFSDTGALRCKINYKIDQCVELLSSHSELLSPDQKNFLDSLKRFKKMNKIAKCNFMLENDMLLEGFLRNIVTFLVV